MKHKGKVIAGIIFSAVMVFTAVSRSYSFGFSDKERETMNLQTYVISDFGDHVDKDGKYVWKANFSRFAKPSNVNQVASPPDPEICNVEYFNTRPLGLPGWEETNQQWCLGIKAQFIKKSYNWIEIKPYRITGANPYADKKPNPAVDGLKVTNIELVGVVKSLDMWVWGGNYNYWLEFYLEDYKGYLHRLPAGDLSYVGWRNLRTRIPDYIPQAEHHVPFLKPLKLIMIKIWSYPTERVDQFYAYFDYMQVQTDVFLERFNGDDLANSRW